MTTAKRRDVPLCPSAQPHWKGAAAFGVVGGSASAPRVIYLKDTIASGPELDALVGPVKSTEVFRYAATCLSNECQHFDNRRCSLAPKIEQRLEDVVPDLPPCAIRAQCRWFGQQGAGVCVKCPQVVTDDWNASETMRELADPSVR